MPYELLRWYWKALRQALRRGCISSTLISIRGPYWCCDLTRLHLPLARLDSQVTSAPDSFRSCCAQSTAGRLCGVKVAGFRDPFKISHVLGCKWDMDRLLGRLEATACPGTRRALGATPRHWPLVAGLCHQLQWSASNCVQKKLQVHPGKCIPPFPTHALLGVRHTALFWRFTSGGTCARLADILDEKFPTWFEQLSQEVQWAEGVRLCRGSLLCPWGARRWAIT